MFAKVTNAQYYRINFNSVYNLKDGILIEVGIVVT